MSVPVPDTAAFRSSVPDAASILPVLTMAGAIVLVPVPPVFSKRPALAMNEAASAPTAMPLLSAMSQVAAAALKSSALSVATASPTVIEPPFSSRSHSCRRSHRRRSSSPRRSSRRRGSRPRGGT